jgi:hypothetical protein
MSDPSGDMDVNGDLIGHGHLEPGQDCPTCERRVPYPKKPTSPNTKPKSYRVPLDEVEAHSDVLTQAAKHLGTHERPHWQYQTYTIALALVLQDEKLRGYAQRRAA